MLDAQRLTAVVVARKGSRRVPGKMYRLIGGVPMIVRKVLQLCAVTRVDEVLVGTDDDEMGARLEAIGDPLVRHYRRPDRFCDEKSATPNDMVRDMVAQVDGGVVLWAHPTNPLCGQPEYDQALDMYLDLLPAHDSIFGATELRSHFWYLGRPLNHSPTAPVHVVAAQLAPVYSQNGAIFIRPAAGFAADGRFVGDKPAMFAMDGIQGWDIDEEWQLDVARLLERGAAPCDP